LDEAKLFQIKSYVFVRSTANLQDTARPVVWESTLTVWEGGTWPLWGRREMQGLVGEIGDKEKVEHPGLEGNILQK